MFRFKRKKVLSFLKLYLYSYALLCIIFIPFPFKLINFQEKLSLFIFGNTINTVKPYLFKTIKYTELSSDTSSLYTLVFILLFVAFLLTLSISFINNYKLYYNKIVNFIKIIIAYYLVFMLVKYGFEKLNMYQFYSPEPNILHTPLGFLEKDILYWSTMGTSYSYNLIIGIIQISTALLLFFRKTRLIGFVFAITIFINIVAINFSFDISVKLFSIFLLFLSLLGFSNYLKAIYQFIIKSVSRRKSSYKQKLYLNILIKISFLLFIFYEIFYKSFSQLNFSKSNILSGSYRVVEMKKNDKVISKSYNKIFFHSKNYIIFQDTLDKMYDFKFYYENNKIILTERLQMPINYNYNSIDSILYLEFNDIKIKTKQINDNNLPIYNDIFHLTLDEIE